MNIYMIECVVIVSYLLEDKISLKYKETIIYPLTINISRHRSSLLRCLMRVVYHHRDKTNRMYTRHSPSQRADAEI